MNGTLRLERLQCVADPPSRRLESHRFALSLVRKMRLRIGVAGRQVRWRQEGCATVAAGTRSTWCAPRTPANFLQSSVYLSRHKQLLKGGAPEQAIKIVYTYLTIGFSRSFWF